MIYDIFISYRRLGGGATAGRINDMLTNDGYSVSYDVDTLREGRFDDQLLARIEQCQDFILVVDKDCFKRTIDPATDPKEDWLWQELSYALKLKKNVIPVLLAGAEFPKRLPEDIDSVRYYNGPQCVHEYFDSFYEKLKDKLHAIPRMAKHSSVPVGKLPNLKLKADLDCVFYLDGEERLHLKAGHIQKFPLDQGEYELMFVSDENETDRIEMEFEMPKVDKLLKINLSTVRENRPKGEAEEKRRTEERRLAELRRQEAQKAAEEQKREEQRKRCEEESRAKDRVFKVGDVEFKMIHVEAGSFLMGSNSDFDNPIHSVELTQDYYIGETVVTQSLWRAIMNNNPSLFKGEDRPVEEVAYFDSSNKDYSALVFIERLNNLLYDQLPQGYHFDLPTEAQWEYAARGGKKSQSFTYAGSDNISEIAWYDGNSREKTHPVKERGKIANELGIYGMSGNVWEWCRDWYNSGYCMTSARDPLGPSSGSYRVLRGGGWGSYADGCRVAYRIYGSPGNGSGDYGFRLALAQNTVSDEHS